MNYPWLKMRKNMDTHEGLTAKRYFSSKIDRLASLPIKQSLNSICASSNKSKIPESFITREKKHPEVIRNSVFRA